MLIKDKKNFHKLLSYLSSNKEFYEMELIGVEKDSAVTHFTQDKKELLIVIAGQGGITIGGEGGLIEFSDVMHIPPNSVRSLANISDQTLNVVSIKYSPRDFEEFNTFLEELR